jgi:peroxiredoxin Q/BCP
MAKLKPGDLAPDFTAATTDGSTVTLSDLRGKSVVLYFYPMDDTPGCTAQACSLRDANTELKKKGAVVLGVSTQGESSHKRFSAKYNLNFPLVADSDKAISKAYGTIGGGGLLAAAKSLTGLADRVTFIIDPKGVITHVIDSPNTKNHAEEVLALIG